MKVLIKNLRVDENLANTRLVKFKKANEDSLFNVPPVNPGVVKHSTGFNICFSPAPVPNLCEGAIGYVGLRLHENPSNVLSYKITNINTGFVYVDEEMPAELSYQNEAIHTIIESVNQTDDLIARFIEDDGAPFVIQNKTNEDIRIKFEITTGENEVFVSEYLSDYYDIDPNDTFDQTESTVIEVCLAKITIPPQCSNLINSESLVLKNSFYGYDMEQGGRVIAYYRSTNLGTGETYVNSVSSDLAWLAEPNAYMTPNSSSVTMPNEKGVTYPKASEFLRTISQQFKYSYNIVDDLNNHEFCKPGGYTIGTFIGIEDNEYLAAPSDGVKVELVIITNGVEDNLGTFTFSKTSFENDVTRILDFFKPKLTAAGFTVTDETRGDGLFFPRQGLKLVKQVPDNTDVYIKLPNSNETHLRWDSSTSDWNRTQGSFWKIKCTGGDINEADTPDLHSITFNPIVVPTPDSVLGPHRLEFITAEEAGEELNPDDYDWVSLNYSTPLVFETCYVNIPPPM